jgi:PAS domain S-box-containing protein
VALALTAAATGSFATNLSGREKAAFLVLGLVWVPVASVVLFAADADGNPVAVYGGPLGDIAVLAIVHTLSSSAGGGALLGYIAIVAFATYTGGRAFGAVLAAIGVAVTLQIDPTEAFILALVLVAIVFLLDRTTTVQLRTAARSARFESKTEAILARVADAVVVTDGAGRVLQWSPAAERILGRRARDAVGSPCDAVVGLHLGERRLDCSRSCPLLASGDASADVLGVEAWRRDEPEQPHRQPLLVNASAVLGPDGTPVEVVHSLRDITRLKQAEEAKTLFLATASHELKTPLTVISGFAATLLADDGEIDPATRRRALEAIDRRAQELSKIVDRLLLSSRIEAGRVRVGEHPVDIVPLVTERVEALRSATGRVATLELHGDQAEAAGDGLAVVTVIDHLLDNACKYSPGGEPVQVSLWTDETRVCLAVSDHGIGMDDEQAHHCFDKFWQAESSDVRRFGGTGIGLYIVRSLAEAMGGRVSVESGKGVGTTFTLELKRFDAPAGSSASASDERTVEELVGMGERTSIREFMRQIGVPERSGR